MPVNQTDKFEAEQRWFAPLLFWLCLVIAVALFASVFLAPKILTWTKLRHDYHSNQLELVAMEKQVQYLDRVADALKNDPQFSEEIARIDFHALEPDTERLSVKNSLNPIMTINAPEQRIQSRKLPWYVPFLESFIQHPDLRNIFLLLSAFIAIMAFAVLPQPEDPIVHKKTSRSDESEEKVAGWMKQRYKQDD